MQHANICIPSFIQLYSRSCKVMHLLFNYYRYYYYYYSLFSRTTWVKRYQKVKTSVDSNQVRDYGILGCSGISWTICKQSAPRSRQTSTPTPHHSIFTGWMLFLAPNQQFLFVHTPTAAFCSLKMVNIFTNSLAALANNQNNK